jgi:hypothetical protein
MLIIRDKNTFIKEVNLVGAKCYAFHKSELIIAYQSHDGISILADMTKNAGFNRNVQLFMGDFLKINNPFIMPFNVFTNTVIVNNKKCSSIKVLA